MWIVHNNNNNNNNIYSGKHINKHMYTYNQENKVKQQWGAQESIKVIKKKKKLTIAKRRMSPKSTKYIQTREGK